MAFKTVTRNYETLSELEARVARQKEVLNKFMSDGSFEAICPKVVPIFNADGSTRSQKNFDVFAAALGQHTLLGKGDQPVRADVLASLCAQLRDAGAFQNLPENVERVVEFEKKVAPTRRETLKSDAEMCRKMNDPNVDVIRGRGEIDGRREQKPKATQAQLEAQAKSDLRDNEIMGEVNHSISIHRGKSHGDTDAQRRILENTRDTAIDENVPAEQIAKQIDALRSEMVNWPAQKAIRLLYADKFKERGVDISQPTPSRYGDNR